MGIEVCLCTSVEAVAMSEAKKCSICKTSKPLGDFYLCQGKVRSECKACTSKKNVKHQRKTKVWKRRYVDSDEQKSYMVDYYAKHRERFAEYRRLFKERHPGYYKDYARRRKNDGK